MNADIVAPHWGRVAILIVNGGASPRDDRWIRLCLDRIARYTDHSDYHIYLWNNRLGAPELEAWLLTQPRLTLLSAAVYEQLHHPHRTPLQRLYHLAREEGAKCIVTLDSDAHPLCAGWLTTLLAALDAGAAVAGVWRDEVVPAIRPYVHPSCLCTTVDFIERYQLRFDFDNMHNLEKTDTLAHFTWAAEAQGLPIHKLPRSNRQAFHYLMGGVYGDLIYHHAAASRSTVVFHNSAKGQAQSDQHRQLRDAAAELLFNQYDAYMRWLQGQAVESLFDQAMQRLKERAEGKHALARRQREANSDSRRAGAWQRIRVLVAAASKKHPLIGGVMRGMRRWLHFVKSGRKMATTIQLDPMAQSFGPQHLHPMAAHGWKVQHPHFVGIGAPKCGTSWWYSLVVEHPQVVPHRVNLAASTNKETQYLLHFQYRGLSAEALDLYRSAFVAPPGAICGEFSVQYFLYPALLEHLASAAPKTKIMVCLRNPIDRFISHWNHLQTKRGVSLFGSLDQQQRYNYNTFSLYTEAMLHSFYGLGLSRLFEHFSREQVLVLQYERMAQSPETELARTYRFLGVDDRFHPKTYQQSVNQGTYIIPKPDGAERARLAAYLKPDVQRVVALCPEVDLSLWPEFAGTDRPNSHEPERHVCLQIPDHRSAQR